MATGGWNGKIEFEGFKGAFKLEFWTMFEEAFRSLDSSSLKKIIFMNTKLAGEHLTLLLSLILWIKPKELSLEFKQNELDDKDLEEFLLDGILDRFAKIIYSVKLNFIYYQSSKLSVTQVYSKEICYKWSNKN